jgi:hypothetical protein
MGLIRRKVPAHYIPIHPTNVATKDWIILLEAGTIVGSSAEVLRVALATKERKIAKKYSALFQRKYFLVLEGYDPRIHAVYFCPQLYRMDSDKQLVALEGEQIGQLLAQSVQGGVAKREPWYEPSNGIPPERLITNIRKADFDTVIIDPQGVEAPE